MPLNGDHMLPDAIARLILAALALIALLLLSPHCEP